MLQKANESCKKDLFFILSCIPVAIVAKMTTKRRLDATLLHMLLMRGIALIKMQRTDIMKSQRTSKQHLHKEENHMNNTRVQELVASMDSFKKENYHRSEMLDEMLKLQSELVKLTFNDEHAMTADLKVYDVEKHLEHLNAECNHAADEELQKFVIGSKEFCNLIKAEISGRRGESIAFRNLEYLKSQNKILKNVELEDGDLRTELDAVVITPKCITIVEVKNTNRNIFISNEGIYYRTGEFLKRDCNIAEKMAVKEALLRKALFDAGVENVKIQSVVVFTDNRIEVQNRFSALKTCFVGQLAYIVDEFRGENIYNTETMAKMQEAISMAERKECYPANFDVEQYKLDFATVMVTLEEASAEKEEVTDEIPEIDEQIIAEENTTEKEPETRTRTFKDVMKAVFTSTNVKYVGSAAAGFTLAVITGGVVNKIINR